MFGYTQHTTMKPNSSASNQPASLSRRHFLLTGSLALPALSPLMASAADQKKTKQDSHTTDSPASREACNRPDFRSRYIGAGFSLSSPAFSYLTVDSLGGGADETNPVFAIQVDPASFRLVKDGNVFHYYPLFRSSKDTPVWTVECGDRKIRLCSEYHQTPPASIGRRAPKVTVTRGWVSLCQKGVTSWLLFVLTISWLGSELKRAGGRAACSIARAPLRSKSDGALLEGGPGGGLLAELFTMVFSAALNWLLLPIVLIVASAHRRDLLHASGHDLFQGKGI